MNGRPILACLTTLAALTVAVPAPAYIGASTCRVFFENADKNHDETLSADEINGSEELVATLRGRMDISWQDFARECGTWGPL